MTNTKLLLTSMSFAAMLMIPSARGAAPSLDDNPYIELYRLRISQSETNLERTQAVATLANARLGRGKKLLGSNAISAEEYDTMVSEAAVAAADVEVGRRKVDEAKAFYRIIEGLIKSKGQIPLCTYEME